MATTKPDLRNQIARELKRKGQGRTLDAETTVDIDLEIDQVHAWLDVQNLTYWGDLTNMPLEAQKQFVSIVAGNLAESKLSDPIIIQRLSNNAAGALASLNRIAKGSISGTTVRFNTF